MRRVTRITKRVRNGEHEKTNEARDEGSQGKATKGCRVRCGCERRRR